MVGVIFICFVTVIATVLIYWKLNEGDKQSEMEGVIKEVEFQLELAESQYRLHKMTKNEYDRLVSEIEKNAMKRAEKRLSELERIVEYERT